MQGAVYETDLFRYWNICPGMALCLLQRSLRHLIVKSQYFQEILLREGLPTKPSSENEILRSAHWFLYELDLRQVSRIARFLYIPSRDHFMKFPFHFPAVVNQCLTNHYQLDVWKWDHLSDALLRSSNSCQYIFHMTLGGSTLLCRCLELLDDTVVIKEASPLTSVHYQRYSFASPKEEDRWRSDLLAVHRINGRGFGANDVVIHKPQYMTNAIISPLLSLDKAASAIFMYQLPHHFTASRLRSKERTLAVRHALTWLQHSIKVTTVTSDLIAIPRLLALDPSSLSDSIVTATFWLLNIVWPLSLLRTPEWRQIRFLGAERFYNEPLSTVISLARLFGITITNPAGLACRLDACLASDAKRPGHGFSQADRIQRENTNLRLFGPQITEAIAFLQDMADLDSIIQLLTNHAVDNECRS